MNPGNPDQYVVNTSVTIHCGSRTVDENSPNRLQSLQSTRRFRPESANLFTARNDHSLQQSTSVAIGEATHDDERR